MTLHGLQVIRLRRPESSNSVKLRLSYLKLSGKIFKCLIAAVIVENSYLVMVYFCSSFETYHLMKLYSRPMGAGWMPRKRLWVMIWASGRNNNGQLGNGNTADSLIPVNAPQSLEEMFTKVIQEHNPLKIRLKNSSAIRSILGLPRFPFFTTK